MKKTAPVQVAKKPMLAKPAPRSTTVAAVSPAPVAKPAEGGSEAPATERPEPVGPVGVTDEEVAQARELLKRPKAQLGLF